MSSNAEAWEADYGHKFVRLDKYDLSLMLFAEYIEQHGATKISVLSFDEFIKISLIDSDLNPKDICNYINANR